MSVKEWPSPMTDRAVIVVDPETTEYIPFLCKGEPKDMGGIGRVVRAIRLDTEGLQEALNGYVEDADDRMFLCGNGWHFAGQSEYIQRVHWIDDDVRPKHFTPSEYVSARFCEWLFSPLNRPQKSTS